MRKGHGKLTSFSQEKTVRLFTTTGLVILKGLLFSRTSPETMHKVMAAAGRGLSNWAALSQGQAEGEALWTLPWLSELSSENGGKADLKVLFHERGRGHLPQQSNLTGILSSISTSILEIIFINRYASLWMHFSWFLILWVLRNRVQRPKAMVLLSCLGVKNA